MDGWLDTSTLRDQVRKSVENILWTCYLDKVIKLTSEMCLVI